ncbi:MAG: hypothetical protein R3348_05800 [Xanthomonadales bacterium]|nr:hypothetical protein [Xanthomonadales bacterium]
MLIRNLSSQTGALAPGILLIFVLTLTASQGAMACHKGKPHGKDAPPSCDVGPPPDVPDMRVTWGGDEVAQGFAGSGIDESTDRLCHISQIASDDSSGRYDCEFNNTSIFYRFDNMASTAIHRRGDDWRCEPNVSGKWLQPDEEYSVSWSGDCTVEPGCDVTITNRFSNDGTIGGSVDRVTLQAFTYGFLSVGGNPFSDAQDVPVDLIHYTMFSPKGRDKVLAQCELVPHEDWPVVFYTTPAE